MSYENITNLSNLSEKLKELELPFINFNDAWKNDDNLFSFPNRVYQNRQSLYNNCEKIGLPSAEEVYREQPEINFYTIPNISMPSISLYNLVPEQYNKIDIAKNYQVSLHCFDNKQELKAELGTIFDLICLNLYKLEAISIMANSATPQNFYLTASLKNNNFCDKNNILLFQKYFALPLCWFDVVLLMKNKFINCLVVPAYSSESKLFINDLTAPTFKLGFITTDNMYFIKQLEQSEVYKLYQQGSATNCSISN